MVSEYGHINRVKIKDGVEVKTVFRSGGYVISHYKDDVRDGKSSTYWNDGKAYRVEMYVAGKMVSTVNIYPQGQR